MTPQVISMHSAVRHPTKLIAARTGGAKLDSAGSNRIARTLACALPAPAGAIG